MLRIFPASKMMSEISLYVRFFHLSERRKKLLRVKFIDMPPSSYPSVIQINCPAYAFNLVHTSQVWDWLVVQRINNLLRPVISTLLILVLTVGNVFSRKVIHRSWSFTEELVVAAFVLITLLAAALACREKGGLVSLTLVTDRLPKKLEKPSVILITVLSIVFSAILFKYGMDKVLTQLANGKRTFVLNWPEWIFWSFVPIGAGCMILHFIEYCLDFCLKKDDEKEDK